ncbi:MAG TPA: septum site-determining protein MinC [Azoarcus taiwanensis]|nr:septum site-determining protein MinC [Azoarcus taiwanensis]
MTAGSPSRMIEFRNASIGATVAVLRDARPAPLADELHRMLGGMADFFNGEPAILDFSGLSAEPDRIDWSGLISMFRRFRLQPIGVRNLSAELVAAARQAGLAQLDGAELAAPTASPTRTAPARVDAPPPPPPAPVAVQAGTMFVDRPVRSGQQVYAKGGDLVLLAGMSNGAEVIADGSIHCYGPLRGRALAGAQGNTAARIITSNFGPEIVSIAGIYKTFEQGIAQNVAGRPAVVRLSGAGREQKLDIEALQLD